MLLAFLFFNFLFASFSFITFLYSAVSLAGLPVAEIEPRSNIYWSLAVG